MQPAGAEASKAYQCGVCKTSYTRSDHLIRHIRTHTKQRPFTCALCSKTFARKDLLKRHTRSHHNARRSEDGSQSADARENSGRHGPRAQQACRSCASKKLRCSDRKPCERCRSRNLPCDYEQTSPSPSPPDETVINVPKRGKGGPPPAPVQVPSGLATTADVFSLQDLTRAAPPAQTAADHAANGDATTSDNGETIQVMQLRPEQDGLAAAAPSNDMFASTQDAMPPDLWDFMSDLPNFGDYVQMDGFLNAEDPELFFLQDVDPFSFASGAQTLTTNIDSPGPGPGSDAYRDSDVSKGWNPAPSGYDSSSNSLEMPSTVGFDVLVAQVDQRLQVANGDMTIETRDNIFATFFGVTNKSGRKNISKTLASMDVLNRLVQYSLLHMQEHQIIPFIHVPSFDVNAQRPELLGALIAYGAVCGRTSSIRAFGYGLQELCMRALQQTLEDDRAAIRDVGIAKALYILLYLDFWSGISSKIETAESNASLGATIIRRGNFLQAGSYIRVSSPLPDDGPSLAHAWSEWSDAESRKRLVYFAMFLDAAVSLARNINPLFAPSEIMTPLPASGDLWTAATAEQWQNILTRKPELGRSARPIQAILRQPTSMMDQLSITDPTVASAAIIAGHWAFVREYRQMEDLLTQTQASNNFVQKSRYGELVSLLGEFKMELDELGARSTEAKILHELLLLHLNASYYAISAYSGRGTMQEATAAKPYVQRWSDSDLSRNAIFHAGQIIRFCRQLKPGHLIDISVVALYHASETMWVWGLIQRAQSPSATPQNLPRIALDSEESPAISRYLRSSRGTPGLTGVDEQFVPLEEPAAISNLAHEVLKANFGNQIYPVTTREVSRILQGFTRIGRSQLPV